MNNRGKPRSARAPSADRAAPTARPLRDYKAALTLARYSKATAIIKATSLGEAIDKAKDIEPDDINDWNSVWADVEVETVEPMEGGQDND